TRPSKPSSLRNKSFTIRRDKVAGALFGLKQGYHPWQIIMLSTPWINLPKKTSSILFSFFWGGSVPRELLLRAGIAAPVTRKMFPATCDPLPSQRAVERTGVANDLFDCFPVTPAAQRIVCLVIEGNVQNWAQIEIETEKTEQPPRDVAMTLDEVHVILVAK